MNYPIREVLFRMSEDSYSLSRIHILIPRISLFPKAGLRL